MATNKFTNLNEDNSILTDLTQFYGFYQNRYRDPFIGGMGFVFMTRPLLFLNPDYTVSTKTAEDRKKKMAYINMTRDPKFVPFLRSEALNSADKKIIESLSYRTDLFKSAFLPIITNNCKNFEPQDVVMEAANNFETKEGYAQPLPTVKTPSEGSGSFNISVTEDSNLSFTKMMEIWVEYIANVTNGTFDANPDMVLSGTLDYTSSLYYFVLSPDGRTIKYWCKYTGCWPTTIPYSPLRNNIGQGEVVDIDLQFSYSVKEDMNPKILEEFNMLSLNILYDDIPYNEINALYTTNNNSPLLNREEMLNSNIGNIKDILDSSERDPLIFYVPRSSSGTNPDATTAHYELVFDDRGYQPEILKDIMGEDKYYINDLGSNYAKEGNRSGQYSNSTFWKIEDID